MTDNKKFTPSIETKTKTEIVLNPEQQQKEKETREQLKKCELREKKYQFTTN